MKVITRLHYIFLAVCVVSGLGVVYYNTVLHSSQFNEAVRPFTPAPPAATKSNPVPFTAAAPESNPVPFTAAAPESNPVPFTAAAPESNPVPFTAAAPVSTESKPVASSQAPTKSNPVQSTPATPASTESKPVASSQAPTKSNPVQSTPATPAAAKSNPVPFTSATPASAESNPVALSPATPAPTKSNPVPFTNFTGSAGKTNGRYWTAIKPGYDCPPSLLTREGDHYDGGKWVCGLKNFGNRSSNLDGHNCTLYSFGISGDSSYEAAVLDATKCSVYGYDPTVDKIGSPLKMSDPRVHFQKTGIYGENDGSSKKTLKTLMDENGHGFIELLKMDVEGAEFDSLERVLKDFDRLPFGQLQVEIHKWGWKNPATGGIMEQEANGNITRLLQNLERKGARVFHVEPNPLWAEWCAEFSIINLEYLSMFVPEEN